MIWGYGRGASEECRAFGVWFGRVWWRLTVIARLAWRNSCAAFTAVPMLRAIIPPMLNTQFLIEVALQRDTVPSFDAYPFRLNAVRRLDTLRLHPAVTFLVGENGAGKSTLLEATAVAWGFNPEGGTLNFNFTTRDSHSTLWRHLRLSRGVQRPRDGFFLRAESFYNVASNIDALDAEPGGRPVIASYGGVSLHAQSHGESFWSLITNRFGGNGLYLLDEPEAALSPMRQMAFLARMHQLVRQRSQFIIATHSPIILAYPNATIYQLDDDRIHAVSYRETDHYRLTRDFLDNPELMLRHLLEE